MTHAENKVDWCLKKAQRELEQSDKHRGLVRENIDIMKAREHVEKAEHYLIATDLLKKENFSDISATTVFYSMYHCLLAIISKFGYESRNQECTFALVYYLIEGEKIDLKKDLLDKITFLDLKEEDITSVEIREQFQYGTSLSIKDDIYKELFELAQEVLSKTKEIIENGKR